MVFQAFTLRTCQKAVTTLLPLTYRNQGAGTCSLLLGHDQDVAQTPVSLANHWLETWCVGHQAPGDTGMEARGGHHLP